jgi:hypothetical protein
MFNHRIVFARCPNSTKGTTIIGASKMTKIKKDLVEELMSTIDHYLQENHAIILKNEKGHASIEKTIFTAIIKTTLMVAEWLADFIANNADDKNFDRIKYVRSTVDQIHQRSTEAIKSLPKKPEKSIILN